MLSSTNPIHRLREIDERLTQITMELAPAYLAIDLLGTDANGVDVTLIESHPKFGPLWSESQVLKSEHMKLTIEVAICYEVAHPPCRDLRPEVPRHPSW